MLTHSPVAALRKSCRFQSAIPRATRLHRAAPRPTSHAPVGSPARAPQSLGFLLGSFAEFDHVHGLQSGAWV